MKKFNPSEFQILADKAYTENPYNDVGVMASAGTGKTTTILWILKKSKNRNALFLAYNKSIADELLTKVPVGVEAKTIHSLGLRTLRKTFKNGVKIQNWMVYMECMSRMNRWNVKSKDRKKTAVVVSKYVDLWRLGMCNNKYEFVDFVSKQNISPDEKDIVRAMEILNWLEKYYRDAKENGSSIVVDFCSMIYVPVQLNLRFQKYKEVILDEAQDASKLMWEIVKRSVSVRGRTVFVGDSSQSIYGFTGASPEVFENKYLNENTIRCKLPVTYRCAKEIARHATKYCSNEIIPYENNPEGFVGEGDFLDADYNDFVLCRNNKPLFSAYYALLGEGKKSYIKDNDLGAMLLSELEDFRYDTSPVNAYNYYESKLNRIESGLIQRGIEKPRGHSKYSDYSEKVEIIRFMVDRFLTPKQAYLELKEMFENTDHRGICLMTYHKSKGLEANSVYLICPWLCPSKWATTPDMIQQEINLTFVAITRGELNVYYDLNFQSDSDKNNRRFKILREIRDLKKSSQ